MDWAQRFISVIPETQRNTNRRINKPSMVEHNCDLPQEAEVGGSQSKTSLGKSLRTYLKNKHKVLSSIPRTTKTVRPG
jgi:hypothetical protein